MVEVAGDSSDVRLGVCVVEVLVLGILLVDEFSVNVFEVCWLWWHWVILLLLCLVCL